MLKAGQAVRKKDAGQRKSDKDNRSPQVFCQRRDSRPKKQRVIQHHVLAGKDFLIKTGLIRRSSVYQIRPILRPCKNKARHLLAGTDAGFEDGLLVVWVVGFED